MSTFAVIVCGIIVVLFAFVVIVILKDMSRMD